MGQKTIQSLIEEGFVTDSEELPVFSPIALELQRLKGRENSSMAQVTGLIMKDQSLAGRVLQVANSSFYGGLKKVETVSHAVVRLGIERVCNLAMMASQAAAHQASHPLVAGYIPLLWQRSFASALGGRWVAQRSGYQTRAEEAFLAGLLHNIGELFLLKVLERRANDREQPLHLTQVLVDEVVEAMHADIGCRLMKRWGLPEQYARVAHDHHAAELNEADVLLVITRLLDVACEKLGIGQTPNPDIVLAATLEAQALGLKEIALAELEIVLEDTMEAAGTVR